MIFLVEGSNTKQMLMAYLQSNQGILSSKLSEHGALLFRNVGLMNPQDFADVCRMFTTNWRDYRDGISPRTEVIEGVFTSTEYPAHLDMAMHNEMSYNQLPPRKIAFFCETPPVPGTGQTPIASSRKILSRIDPRIVARFKQKGLKYIVNAPSKGKGPGVPWQTMYQSDDRREVEKLCASMDIQCFWKKDDSLMTTRTRSATRLHHSTQEETWCNHAHLFHPTDLPERTQQTLKRVCKTALDFPKNCLYADDSEIDPNDLTHIRSVLTSCEFVFDWQKGDLLLLDNFKVCHGRKPFQSGTDRRILASLLFD